MTNRPPIALFAARRAAARRGLLEPACSHTDADARDAAGLITCDACGVAWRVAHQTAALPHGVTTT